MVRPSLDQQLADSTSLFKLDAPALTKQLLQPPLRGSSLYNRHKRLADRASKLTIPMTTHPTDPLWEMLKAIRQILGSGESLTLNELADRTNPHDPLLEAREALMLITTAVSPVDVRLVAEDPDAPVREFMRSYVTTPLSATKEAIHCRVGYRWDVRQHSEGFAKLGPIAESLATTDIRRILIYRCRGLVFSYVKDFSALMADTRDSECLDIILDYDEPHRFKYRYSLRPA